MVYAVLNAFKRLIWRRFPFIDRDGSLRRA
jgi:hypothetical protein